MSCFFFFKQKTAYELRISDWSSDVCSSDLCGSSPRCVIFAPTNSDAEPLGHAATQAPQPMQVATLNARIALRSEEHTSELQSLMRISYAVFCLKKKTNTSQ